MQITIDLPVDITQAGAFKQNDWLREIAVALF
jgi:predicted HTH domain antitoxin